MLFKLGNGDGAHVGAFAVGGKRLLVGNAEMGAVEVAVAQFGIGECHAEDVGGDFITCRIQRRAVGEAARHGITGARDMRVWRGVFRLEAGERVGFHHLVEQFVAVARQRRLLRPPEGVVEEIIEDERAVGDDGAVVGDERRHLRKRVDGGEFGRRRPRIHIGELQLVHAAREGGEHDHAGVGGSGAGVEFHGRLRWIRCPHSTRFVSAFCYTAPHPIRRKPAMKRILIAAALAAVFAITAHAAPRWNEQTLNAAAAKAEAEINEYLQKGTGPIAQLMPDGDWQYWQDMERYMENADGSPIEKSFSQLDDSDQRFLLGRIFDKFGEDDRNHARRIGYGVLRLHNVFKSVPSASYRDEAIQLYRDIISDDAASANFALAQMKALPDIENSYSYEHLLKEYGFFLKNVETVKSRDNPEVCLRFNRPITAEPQQDWRPLIHFEPAAENHGRYAGEQLCYAARWEQQYTIHVDPRLATTGGLELYEAQTRDIDTGSRPPLLRFVTSGKTLALTPDAALTVETGNIETVQAELWQVPGNNLVENMRDLIDSTRFPDYHLASNASLIWQGSFAPQQKKPNTLVQSRLAFRDMAGDDARSGVYVLVLKNGDRSGKDDNGDETRFDSNLTQTFTVTDQGLTAYRTPHGILAELRDLQTGAPVARQKVTLYAQNNRILAESETDSQGIARFTTAQTNGKNGDAPSHLISEKDHHLAYLRIEGQGIDLSNKGADGRGYANPTLAHWSWHDRGIYRPKDTLNALWLIKTPDGKAFRKNPLWLEIRRPDGALMHSQLLEADASGAYRYSTDIPANARLGDWNIRLSLGKGGAVIVNEPYTVDSVIPRQIESHLRVTAAADSADIELKADWLYGAPAGGLLSSGQWRIIADDFGETHPAWQGWQIGHFDAAVNSRAQKIPNADTDAAGKRHITLRDLERPFDTRPQALRADTVVTAPDGSTIDASGTALLPRSTPYAALKRSESGVHIAVINDRGEQQSAPLDWTLYRIHYEGYYGYDQDGWGWISEEQRETIGSGSLITDGKNPATLDLPQESGRYILAVQGEDPATAASIAINNGWWWYGDENGSGKNDPSALILSADRAEYKAGDTIMLNLRAPFDGRATIKVANRDHIIANYQTTLKDGQAQLQIPWQKDWENGIWLLANAWNKDGEARNRRAVGLRWLGADLGARRLSPGLTLPANPLPEQPYTVAVHVPDATADTWVNLAIVDDGLYRLAAPSFSDPLAAIFGKKQPDISLYDTFGSIIRQTDARLAALRSGADSVSESERASLASLPDLDLTLIAHWSGPLKVDAGGNVRYTIPITHYNGRLRIMTAAYNADQAGIAEETAIIKAPVVAEINSPRYLTRDDNGVFSLSLHNTTGRTQRLNLDLRTDGLTLAATPALPDSLAPDQRITLNYPYHADKAGDAYIKAAISGDYSETLERRIPVRAPTLPQIRSRYQRLDGGATLELSGLDAAHLNLDQGLPDNAYRFGEQLAAYPYWCNEQTTGKLWGELSQKKADPKILHSLERRLAGSAHYDGSYTLWWDGRKDRWLTAYAGEALTQMRHNKQLKNPESLARTLTYLRNNSNGDYNSEHAHADSYAYYTLAYAGESVRGLVLRYHRQAGTQLNRADSLDIATALALLGEYRAAGERLASTAANKNSDNYGDYHYGSRTSITAHNLTRLKQLQSAWQSVADDPRDTLGLIRKMHDEESENLRAFLAADDYLSTQELAWLARLAGFAGQLPEDTAIRIDGEDTTLGAMKKGEYNGSIRITNPGKQPLWLTSHDLYSPPADAASSNGWEIAIRYEDREGNALDPEALPNNTDIRITATFTQKGNYADYHSELIYTYPTPAGITLTPLRGRSPEQGKDDDRVQYRYHENRDDRHIAAFTIDYDRRHNNGSDRFEYTINARTTRAGTWHAPGAGIENMYHPEEHARQAAQTVRIR